MDDEARKTLELFVEKADRLVKYIRENHARNSIVVNPGGLIGVFRNAEGEEWQIASTLDGFLVTLRMFVQPRDRIALYPLARDSQRQPIPQKPKLLNLPGLSPGWCEKVERAYQLVDALLVITPPNLIYNGESITRRKVLETFLYGDNVHVNAPERETFNEWRRNSDLFGELQFEFLNILGFIFSRILEVAEACRFELSLNAKPKTVTNPLS
jgi:hypothetical protein